MLSMTFVLLFPHLHMMALALALDQLPCSLLQLAELEIVDSLVWALCVSAYQYNIYNHVWLLMPLPLI